MNFSVLAGSEQARIDALIQSDGFARDVAEQLNHILSSKAFARLQDRARAFLIYVVAKTLLNQSAQLKESTVAIAVFGRTADFDAKETSLVREAARTLRDRLAQYARGEGRDDAISITLPLGTYAPRIDDRRPSVALHPIENWHPLAEQAHLCDAVGLELAFQLGRSGVRVSALTNTPSASGHRFVLRGCLEPAETHVRMSFSLAEAQSGHVLVSPTVEGARDDLLRLSRDVALVVAAALTGDAAFASGHAGASHRAPQRNRHPRKPSAARPSTKGEAIP